MKKFLLALLLMVVTPASAQLMTDRTWTPNGFQQLTPVAATSLTVPAGTALTIMCALTATVSWRDDGTAPTAAIGMPLAANACITYRGNPAAFQAISATGTLNVSYYK